MSGLRKIYLISIPIFFITFTQISLRYSNVPDIIKHIELEDRHNGFLISTAGCKIPYFPIVNQFSEKYFNDKINGIHCNKGMPALVQSNLTSLFLIKTSFAKYDISDTHLLQCCYEELKRIPPKGQKDNLYEFGACFDFGESVKVKEEFVRVKCDYDKRRIYEDFFAFVPLKHGNISLDKNQQKLNVLMIGLDGMSRLNFHRQMPKFVKYLKQIDFVEFLGYNKIADNTYPNLVAVLTGKNDQTIRRTCRRSSKYFDNCSFIWDKFKLNNYTTSFGEDASWMGIFTHEEKGFQQQPTDYMWGFFDQVAEKLLGNSPSSYITQCIGTREVYKVFVQYIHNFVSQMETWKMPYFGFFWSSTLSHDDLNKPRIGDEHYLNFFRSMYDKGYFENTVVIMMSDHGIRYGKFRETYQGRIEERLPFFFIRLPKKFEEKYPLATFNLKQNSKMLTTPFDLHETLIHISSPLNLIDQFIENGERKSKTKSGFSLFHQLQPTRNCADAGIPFHWCSCLNTKTIEISSEVIELANFTINYMNEILIDYVQCVKLQLKTVSKAEMYLKKPIKYFILNFQTIPGDGLFEATVERVSKTKMEIVGLISRLNFYGNQSACITDHRLQLYCYCEKNKWS